MARTGEKLLSDAKAAAVATVGGGEIEKKNMRGRDLLSLLVKANMAADIPESQRLSDEDVLARTFSNSLWFDYYFQSSSKADAFFCRDTHILVCWS